MPEFTAKPLPDPVVSPPVHAVRSAVHAALAEDLIPLGDLSAVLVPAGATAVGRVVPRADGVLAGTACFDETFLQMDPEVEVLWNVLDGSHISKGQIVGTVSGRLSSILSGERTALNFLCHLSGVATTTAAVVAAAAEGGPATVWDTRKTTPGLRSLQKAAVRAGGGASHRGNLSDWIMLKDNHLAGFGITEGVARARAAWPARTVQVEVDDLDGLREAIEAGVEIVLLDNFSPDEARAAVAVVNAAAHGGARRPLLECSGGIDITTIAAYAATGVDLLSTSQLTQGAPALDIGLDVRP